MMLFLFLAGAVFVTLSLGGLQLFFPSKSEAFRPGFFAPGLAFLIILVNFFYGANLRIFEIYWIVCPLALLGLFQVLRTGNGRTFITENLQLVALSVLGSIPCLTIGTQFTLFQGNHWDMLTYLSCSIVYQDFRFSEILAFTPEFILENPLREFARGNLYGRPAVHLLYSFYSYFFREDLLNFGYAFLVMVCSGFCMLWAGYIKQFSQNVKISNLVLTVALLGFVPVQMMLDLNAWSHLVALPIMLVCYFQFNALIEKSESFLPWLFFTTSAALISIYPEGFFLSLAFVTFSLLRYRRNHSQWPPYISNLLKGLALCLLVTLTNIKGTWGFLFYQAQFASKERTNWHEYFFKVYFDKENILLSIFSLPGRLLGFYIPSAPWVNAPILIGLNLSLLLLSFGFLFFVFKNRKNIFVKSDSSLFLAVFGGLFFLSQRFWVLGKFYLMFFPMVVTFLLQYLSESRNKRILKSLVILNLMLFGYRLFSISTNTDGIHYLTPWPAIQDPKMKNQIDIDFVLSPNKWDRCSVVEVQASDPWLSTYAQISGLLHRLPVNTAGILKSNFGFGGDFGTNPTVNPAQECIVRPTRI